MNTAAGVHLKPPPVDLYFSRNPFPLCQFRRRRYRRTAVRHLTLRSQLPDPFQNFLSSNYLQFLAPALGAASGFTLYLSQLRRSRNSDIGEWILFTSPSAFNRFVFLRCPSISELLEDVKEKLVQEDRHFVRLDNGRINVRGGQDSGEVKDKLVYRRVCLNTKDGGVISLDWPESLDLEVERGFDSTLLLVPGTPEGSMAENVRSFVSEALRRGFFPVVMNPRGCAGSPLTSARLFTAADSDDVSTAVQFISKARPWTSLMSIGWDYGANMLMKYLAEVGERTPLTAAACINNPFDLEEATRCSPYNTILDQKLTGGLKDILRSNKALFHGRKRDFNVEGALAAKSVREFEKELSMVSYGFEEIEDFYSKSSTRGLIGDVKIPVFFIQNDDAATPLFSIPRSSIAENPFTSLLLCSCVPSNTVASGGAVVSWCQNLAIEWLSAVELGLLKGRHPLLKDIDVNINPSKLTLVEDRRTSDHVSDDEFVDLTLADDNNYAIDLQKEIPDQRITVLQSRIEQDLQVMKFEEEIQKVGDDEVDVESAKEVADLTDPETGQVLQTAEVVMGMLDATMPGILEEEDKKKVLIAMSQGETLMKALQDAVPEDVRGKLTSAVSGFLHAQNTNVKLKGLFGFTKRSETPSEINTQNEVKTRASPNSEGTPNDIHSSNDTKKAADLEDGVHDSEHGSDKAVVEKELEFDSSGKSKDLGNSGTFSSQEGDVKGSDTTIGSTDGTPDTEVKREGKNQKNSNSSSDESTNSSSDVVEEASSLSEPSTDSQLVEKEGNDNQNKDNKAPPSPDINKPTSSDSAPPTFDVVQALDALTGMDDSTQVAVNSVFGVIEDMITKLEEENDDKQETKEQENIEDEKIEDKCVDETAPNKQLPNLKNDVGMQSASLKVSANPLNIVGNGSTNIELPEKSILHGNNVIGDLERSTSSNYDQGTRKNNATGGVNEANYTNKHVNGIPLYVIANSYQDYLQREYLHKYLLSKIPNSKPLDLNMTTSLLLDYYPEDGQWRLLEQPEVVGDSIHETDAKNEGDGDGQICSPKNTNDVNSYIEPSYVVRNPEEQQNSFGGYGIAENLQENVEIDCNRLELMKLVKSVILDALRVEIARKLSADDMKEMKFILASDLEKVANAVSLAIGLDKNALCFLVKDFCTDHIPEKVGALHGEHIVSIISSAILRTSYLKKVLPVGVAIGSCLAALRKYFDVGENGLPFYNQRERHVKEDLDKSGIKGSDYKLDSGDDKNTYLESTRGSEGEEEEAEIKAKSNDSVMFGAVTAALGASTLLVQRQNSCQGEEMVELSSKSFKEKSNSEKAVQKVDETEAGSDKTQNNVVASLAEKAMSVAGPVVPTTEDGEVDQERLVAMLADLGQRGGLMRLVAKVALLWGGIRGAVSLTDKLISFLRMAERPLYQRIIGFSGMVLVLWSPVIVPFLPALVQSWSINTPSKFAELVIIIGLYAAVTILVTIWGKRIRGYEDPLEEYGLDMLKVPRMQDLFLSLIGGVMLVMSIQSINAMLGFLIFSWPSSLAISSLNGIPNFRALGKVIILAVQGIIMATSVVLVEELLFRAWLPEEIAADLGYHQGIIISGLVSALFQRSLRSVPGLWLLYLALAGLRQRNQGSLTVPIGIHAGIMASSFILQKGGFLTYKCHYPLWLTGTHPFQPFSGIVGLLTALSLAIILYPRQHLQKKKRLQENHKGVDS